MKRLSFFILFHLSVILSITALSLAVRLSAQPTANEREPHLKPQKHFASLDKFRFSQRERKVDTVRNKLADNQRVRKARQRMPERLRQLMRDRRADDCAGLPAQQVDLPGGEAGISDAADNDRLTGAQSLTNPSHSLELFTTETCRDTLMVGWAVNYASGLASPEDYGSAVVTDGLGNTYVTGTSDSDYVTIKYDSLGAQQWVARYDGAGNSGDAANAIAVDTLGNVYVTGLSCGSGTSYDFATVKYDASGLQQWVARYNGPGNSDDKASAVAVDASGNVFVTGWSVGPTTGYDYATVKYDASGVQQWVERYNGPGNSNDKAYAVAVDPSGNAYVTGSSVDSATGYDYATVKYDASGAQQWVARYDSGGAAAIAVDVSGNVYVTGTSYSSVTGADYATVKYNASGTQQWIARYNGPDISDDVAMALAVDALENVYVTGYSYSLDIGTSYDYATVKYDASGAQQWAARYNGPGDVDDYGSSIVVDASGNVYVTGSSPTGPGLDYDYATVKYDASGAEQWVARYNGPANSADQPAALAIDASGNVYVTGISVGSGTAYDYATVKYDASGTPKWVARYDGGPGCSYDDAEAIALDASGNVYVTGWSVGSGTYDDYATVKYNASGVQQWVARYNGPGNSSDWATAIAVDASGNVYVTGSSVGSGTAKDYATVKYDASGTQQWVARYNGPGNSDDQPIALALDASGNVYVTGGSGGSGTGEDYATVKYDASGAQQWVAQYSGPGNSSDYATGIAIDASGNVYVTGESVGSGTSLDYATVKYDPSGAQQWVARYNGPVNSFDWATAIAVDASGNVYVTGSSAGPGHGSDYATVKYGPSGVQQWAARYDSGGATAIAVDGSTNVYVTGTSYSSATGYDYATVKYDSAGAQRWVARYNGPGNDLDEANAITLDDLRNVYVTGTSLGSGTFSDYATVKYDASGAQQWVARYSSPGNSSDDATAIAVDASGNVYAAGSTSFTDGTQYTTIKYKQIPSSYEYRQRWNLVSLPKRVSSPMRTAVFPSSISHLFEFDGGYVERESLETGRGYWLRFPSAECIPIVGDVLLNDTLDVVTGWNLIGSIGFPVAAATVSSTTSGMIASNFYGYKNGYFVADTVQPGKGYWVKVNQAGKLILASSGTNQAKNPIRIISSEGLPPPPPEETMLTANLPPSYSLAQCYPNPFNPRTTIKYELPTQSHVTLKIYNLLGQVVQTLTNDIEPGGYQQVEWNASNFASGVYFYRLEAVSVSDLYESFTSIKKCVSVK